MFTIHPLGTFLIGAEAHKPFFESFDEELDQAPVYKFMIPIFGKGVVYDAPIRKRRQQYRVLGSSLRPNMLKRYPEIIAKECRQFYRVHLGTTPGAAVSVDILHKFADLTILTASASLHGREVRENGDVYEGQFARDKRHGRGRFISVRGEEYDGGWADGKRDGQGVSVVLPVDEAERQRQRVSASLLVHRDRHFLRMQGAVASGRT